MQFWSSFSRYSGSLTVPESCAVNVINSPESFCIRAVLAYSTSWRVGNLNREFKLVFRVVHRTRRGRLQFCGLERIMKVERPR